MFSKYTKIASITLAAFIVNMTIVLNAHAQYSQIYAEISYGQLELEGFKFFVEHTDFEDKSGNDDVTGIAVGRRFNDNLAVEVGYFEFGSFESDITSYSAVPVINNMNQVIGIIPSVPDFAEFKMSAVQISVIGSLNWGQRAKFFVKGGFSQGSVTAKIINNNYNFSARESGGGSGLHIGVGVLVNITRSIALELEYQLSEVSNSLLDDNVGLETTSLGLRYNF